MNRVVTSGASTSGPIKREHSGRVRDGSCTSRLWMSPSAAATSVARLVLRQCVASDALNGSVDAADGALQHAY